MTRKVVRYLLELSLYFYVDQNFRISIKSLKSVYLLSLLFNQLEHIDLLKCKVFIFCSNIERLIVVAQVLFLLLPAKVECNENHQFANPERVIFSYLDSNLWLLCLATLTKKSAKYWPTLVASLEKEIRNKYI